MICCGAARAASGTDRTTNKGQHEQKPPESQLTSAQLLCLEYSCNESKLAHAFPLSQMLTQQSIGLILLLIKWLN